MIQRDYAQEREDAEAERDMFVAQAEAKRQHELSLAKLKLQIKPRNDTWQTLFKAPTYPLVVLCITILALAGKAVPQSLTDFIGK